MKKIFRIFIILSITVLFTSCGQEATTYEAKEALSKHLIERYGEEFEIGYMGRRSDGKEVWYEAEIYPSKYVGTPKERDKYYKESGTVNIKKGIFGEKLGKAGDTYGIVKVNESAEEFYGKKLKELFGDNVLQVYDIWFNRILENYSFENIIKVSDEERTALIIKGGIYIFGRVENDEDREWYRKQIYEFIQFMKETGTFEYVDLNFTISDERVLSYKFQENKELKEKIMKMRKKANNYSAFFRKRNELMKKIDGNKITQKEREEILNNINRGNFSSKNFPEFSGGNTIFYKKLYSPKYIESHNLKDKEKIEYNTLEEMQFTWEIF
ncbi:hypothetical protein F350042L8_02890 [Fusobacterium ulcerans]|uniref:hypothetical protein n=1 Tax=Fusobacterium ulcerans TaxID=861 RepID=UPI0034BFBF60